VCDCDNCDDGVLAGMMSPCNRSGHSHSTRWLGKHEQHTIEKTLGWPLREQKRKWEQAVNNTDLLIFESIVKRWQKEPNNIDSTRSSKFHRIFGKEHTAKLAEKTNKTHRPQ
jgi:hypothetical protein